MSHEPGIAMPWRLKGTALWFVWSMSCVPDFGAMTTSHALSWRLRFPTAGKHETAWERKVAGCSCWGFKDPDEVIDLRVRDWVLNAVHDDAKVGNLPFTNSVCVCVCVCVCVRLYTCAALD